MGVNFTGFKVSWVLWVFLSMKILDTSDYARKYIYPQNHLSFLNNENLNHQN